MVFQPKIYFEGNIAKENCSLFLKILCFFQLGGRAWAYIRNGPNAAASIAPTLIRPCMVMGLNELMPRPPISLGIAATSLTHALTGILSQVLM